MSTHDWDWSRIVNPQLVERALADQEQRAQRQLQRAGRDTASVLPSKVDRPVAA